MKNLSSNDRIVVFLGAVAAALHFGLWQKDIYATLFIAQVFLILAYLL